VKTTARDFMSTAATSPKVLFLGNEVTVCTTVNSQIIHDESSSSSI